MAKKKKPALKKVAKEMPFWPGLTRLYDKQVDCGAILMCGEHAAALLEAVDIAVTVIADTAGAKLSRDDALLLLRLKQVRRMVRFTFVEDK